MHGKRILNHFLVSTMGKHNRVDGYETKYYERCITAVVHDVHLARWLCKQRKANRKAIVDFMINKNRNLRKGYAIFDGGAFEGFRGKRAGSIWKAHLTLHGETIEITRRGVRMLS